MTIIKKFDPDFYHDLIMSNIKCHTARRIQIGKPESTATNVMYPSRYLLYPKSFYGLAEFMPDHLEINKRLKDVPEIIIPCSKPLHVIAFRGSRNIQIFTSINQVVIFVGLVVDSNTCYHGNSTA